MRSAFSNTTSLISGIVNYLYPSDCPACGSATDNFIYAPLCTSCWLSIKRYSGPACRICSTPFASEYSDICSQCLKKPPFFDAARSFGIYSSVLATAINIYKFHGIERLSKPLGKLLLEFDSAGADAIIPVPLSKSSLRHRWFNQSLLLARVVAKQAKIRLDMDGLRKERETSPQVRLTARERLLNVRGAFRATGIYSGKKLLLIDDVMTTGATANECARQLLQAGAVKVNVLTLARAGSL